MCMCVCYDYLLTYLLTLTCQKVFLRCVNMSYNYWEYTAAQLGVIVSRMLKVLNRIFIILFLVSFTTRTCCVTSPHDWLS